MKQKIGVYAFLLGIAISVLAGVLVAMGGAAGSVVLVLVILGIIVGILNIGDKEVLPFLVASIALILTSMIGVFSSIPYVGVALEIILDNLAAFVAPAAAIMALVAVFALAKD